MKFVVLALTLTAMACTPSGVQDGANGKPDKNAGQGGIDEFGGGVTANNSNSSSSANDSSQQSSSGNNTTSEDVQSNANQNSDGSTNVGDQQVSNNSEDSSNSSNVTVNELGQSKGSSTAGMCRRVDPGQKSTGLFLAGPSDGSDSPQTVVVKVTKLRDGTASTASCTGFLSNLRHGVAVAKDGKLTVSEVRLLILPRITVAKHCLLLDQDASLSKIQFTRVDDATKSVEYSVDSNGDTSIGEGADKKSGPWHIDLAALTKRDNEDPCTTDYKSKAEQSGTDKTSCFATSLDQFEVITNLEADGRKFAASNSGVLGADGATIEKAARLSVLGLDEFASGTIDWRSLFSSSRSRFVSPLSYGFNLMLPTEEYANTLFTPENEKQAYDILALRLTQISVVSSIIGTGDQPLIEIKPENGRWENVLKIYGAQDGVAYLGSTSKTYYRISAIGLKSKYATLTKGHSGTLLLGHWLQISRPLLNVSQYRQMMGVLSTVGGEDVCTGDDLTCCEKIR